VHARKKEKEKKIQKMAIGVINIPLPYML